MPIIIKDPEAERLARELSMPSRRSLPAPPGAALARGNIRQA